MHRVPICLHINMGKFDDEAMRVFQRFPDLPLIVPHYGLWSGRGRRQRLDNTIKDWFAAIGRFFARLWRLLQPWKRRPAQS